MGYFILDTSIHNSLQAYIALIPILWLLISLGFLNVPAYKACPIGFAIAFVIAVTVWDMPFSLAYHAALEGGMLAIFPILWVIMAAIFAYNLSIRTGALERIKNLLSSLSGDRRIQALLIAWGFGGFLESTAGFGTAVAIPASILIALGFQPYQAAITCLLANTIAVAFGVVGIPVTTLAKITDLPVMPLSIDITLQLLPFVILLPFIIVFVITGSLAGLKDVWIPTIAAGLSFGLCQLLVAAFIGPELPAVISSIISLAITVLCVKLFPPVEEWRFPYERGQTADHVAKEYVGTFKDQVVAWGPYILLLLFVLGTSKLVPVINEPLSKVKSSLTIYNDPGAKPFYIDWIITPGTLIMTAAIIGGLIQGASVRALATALGTTIIQMQKTTLTVISIVSMAKVLGYSGMVGSIAVALASTTGKFYPFFAPLIGALGTFITGNDTSSNVLFGLLQKQTAAQIGSNPIWMAAANTSGACAGKMISPQSIAIVTSTTGLTGREGEILTTTVKCVIGFLAGLGIITYSFAF